MNKLFTMIMMVGLFLIGSCTEDPVAPPTSEPELVGCEAATISDWNDVALSGTVEAGGEIWYGFTSDAAETLFHITLDQSGFECSLYSGCDGENGAGEPLFEFSSIGNGVDVGIISGGDYYLHLVNTRQRTDYTFSLSLKEIIYGCLDSDATNYNSEANVSDSNCIYPLVQGCTDELACNYNPLAEEDDGSCLLPETNFDCNGNCIVDVDCLGVCGGTTIIDQCNVCGGDGTSCTDCVGVIGGNAYIDGCGDCVGGSTGNQPCATDCAGVPGGTAQFDNCGVCDDDVTNNCVPDCFGQWGGTAEVDDCGECGGNGADHECWDGDLVCFPHECSAPPIPGCTDPEANNYNPNATVDDGTCDYQECPEGWLADCNGNCAPADWVGDGYCDDGSWAVTNPDTGETYPIYLDCEEFENDGGDCDVLQRNNSTPPSDKIKIK
jgi:hypothetical protein